MTPCAERAVRNVSFDFLRLVIFSVRMFKVFALAVPQEVIEQISRKTVCCSLLMSGFGVLLRGLLLMSRVLIDNFIVLRTWSVVVWMAGWQK